MARDSAAAAGSSEGGARSVTRKALEVLDAFVTDKPSLSLTEIAAAADLPLPTAHRIVSQLVDGGALVRQPNGRYSVGLRLWEIGQTSLRQTRSAARLHLQDLFTETHETAQLAYRTGRDALYIDRVYSSQRTPRASRVGGRLPLHLTAVGKVLLAEEGADFVAEYLAGPLERRTAHSLTDPVRLEREIERVRRDGYATTVEEVRPGSASLAVPVRPDRGPASSAVGIVVQSNRAATMHQHMPALRRAASRLAKILLR